MAPWLDDDEVAQLCKPLRTAAARVRFLKRAGLHVATKPNGHPVIMRSELERVFGAARLAPTGPGRSAATEPNATGLQDWAAKRRRPLNGAQAQGR